MFLFDWSLDYHIMSFLCLSFYNHCLIFFFSNIDIVPSFLVICICIKYLFPSFYFQSMYVFFFFFLSSTSCFHFIWIYTWVEWLDHIVTLFLFFLFFTLQYCIGFAIHQHASAADACMSLICSMPPVDRFCILSIQLLYVFWLEHLVHLHFQNFSLEDNCFTILCWFLPYINMNQSQVYYVPSLLNLPPISHPIPPLYLVTKH